MSINSSDKLVRVLIVLLNDADGREKLTKLVQFSIQYHVLWLTRIWPSHKFPNVRRLTSYLSSSRRVFKLCRVLEDCYSFPTAFRVPVSSLVVRLCMVARATLSIVTDCLYDVATASHVGVIRRKLFDPLMRVHDFFWFWFSVSDLALIALQLRRDPQARFLQQLDMMKCLLYMSMAASNKQFKYWFDWEGFLVCGIVSTALSLYKHGLKIAKGWEMKQPIAVTNCSQHQKTQS